MYVWTALSKATEPKSTNRVCKEKPDISIIIAKAEETKPDVGMRQPVQMPRLILANTGCLRGFKNFKTCLI